MFKGAANEMVGSMSQLQNLVYIPLSEIKFPATTLYLYSNMIEIVTFDFFPTDDWYPAWFNLSTTEPFSPKFALF